MEGCPNEANYVGAIDRDFIGVSPLEQLQRKYFFRDEAPSSFQERRGRFVRSKAISGLKDSAMSYMIK